MNEYIENYFCEYTEHCCDFILVSSIYTRFLVCPSVCVIRAGRAQENIFLSGIQMCNSYIIR